LNAIVTAPTLPPRCQMTISVHALGSLQQRTHRKIESVSHQNASNCNI